MLRSFFDNATVARVVLVASLATAPAFAEQLPPEERGTVSVVVTVGVGWYQVGIGEMRRDANALARALELAAPGCTIDLLAGDHPGFGLGFESRQAAHSMGRGGIPMQPVVVRGRPGARLVAGLEDTLKIAQQYPVGHVRFENVEIQAGNRSGVIFYGPGADGAHRGFEFIDCVIDGGYDHAKQEGRQSKWGVIGHGLADFVFAGRTGRAVVRNICHEHAFYIQNPVGDLTFEKVDASRLGRTFIQVVAREKEGPPGRGRIVLRDCRVEDTALAGRDGHKGGTAFTFAGRLTDCSILVERCTYRAGFAADLLHLTRPPAPYGTSALVAWDGNESLPNGTLVLRDNHFEMAAGTGDRPLVAIGACRSVSIEGRNRFLAGGYAVALSLDPVGATGRLAGVPNGHVHVSAATETRGDVQLAGRKLTAAEVAALDRGTGGR